MLKPAYVYKDELEKKFAEVMYDDDYFLYMGYPHGHELPKIAPADYIYQWAIVNNDPKKDFLDESGYFHKRVIGYFAYQIQPETDTVLNFGLYSFDKGNPLVGHDIFKKMIELILNHRRVEWRGIEGNTTIKHYDRFIEKYGGSKVTLHNVIKDPHGVYRDEYIYEILKDV